MASSPPAASVTASAIRSATPARPPPTACDRPKPGNSGTITGYDFDNSGTMASKLARSDSSEWNRNNGGPLPDCAALTVPCAKSRSIAVSLSNLAPRAVGRAGPSIDKSKHAEFKSLGLDVIFHDCDITASLRRNLDAFTG